MGWTTNPIMEWSDDNGVNWNLISDHSRSPLSVSVDRIENKQRMANGTMRRYVVAKKRSWNVSWDSIPNNQVSLLANGKPGKWMEDWHNTHDGAFLMRLRDGSAKDAALTSSNSEVVTVMVSDFSKEVVKRTPKFDLWNMDITLEEV